jgi:hypothetical protein
MSSINAGEHCAGITIPAGLVQPGDGIPSIAIIIIVPRKAIRCSVLTPLSQTPAQRLSLRTYVG